MKHEPIISVYSEGDRVVITAGDFINKSGIVNRIGAAGYYLTYVHVALDTTAIVMTFTEKQLRKE